MPLMNSFVNFEIDQFPAHQILLSRNRFDTVVHSLITRKMVPQITPLDGDLADLMNETNTGPYRSGYIKVNGCIMPQYYKEFINAVENFEVRDDDVWVCSFPKSEQSFLSVRDGGTATPQSGNDIPEELKESVNYISKLPSPRFIKTHLPHDLLPRQLRTGEKKPKIVYVARNPKDACISYYHFAKYISRFRGRFDEFCTLFLGDTVCYAPYWKQVLSYWNKRNDDNVLFLKYEDMKKDLPSVIKQTAVFLGKSLTDDEMSFLTEHLSFSSMRANPLVNYEKAVSFSRKILQNKSEGHFMRSGTTEQWKTAMTPELIKRFDDWIYTHSNDTGLSL